MDVVETKKLTLEPSFARYGCQMDVVETKKLTLEPSFGRY